MVQQGFGPSSPTYQLSNNSDGAAGNVDSALDAATGAVVTRWDSVDGSGGIWNATGLPHARCGSQVPIPSQYGTGLPLIVAGRDTGAGVFGAYASSYGTTTKVRLLQYGAGSVAVGKVKGLHANVTGLPPGPTSGSGWSGQSDQRQGDHRLHAIEQGGDPL